MASLPMKDIFVGHEIIHKDVTSNYDQLLATPNTLQYICTDVFCRGLASGQLQADKLFSWHSEIFFPNALAETLISRLSTGNSIKETELSLFALPHTTLKRVHLHDASGLNVQKLRMLKGHKIEELEVRDLKESSISELLGCLSAWSEQHMHTLNLAGSTFMDKNRFTVAVGLSRMKGLRSLNVAGTEFNTNNLEMVLNDLPLLEELDISLTKVNNVSSLMGKERLISLSLYGLNFTGSEPNHTNDVVCSLSNLVKLDVSTSSSVSLSSFELHRYSAQLLLQKPSSLPKLAALDLSGHRNIASEDLINFINTHPNLRFLGLVFTDTCREEPFLSHGTRNLPEDVPKLPEQLTIAGCGSEKQVVPALKLYQSREKFIQNGLYGLFKQTTNLAKARPDLIMLVIDVANRFRHTFSVQMAATACLYNMTKSSNSHQLHPSILKAVVETDLQALEIFINEEQIVKNILLTICSDHILQDINFDRFRCAKLVMDVLRLYSNHTMSRMSVAICSILAAKITTEETSKLGSSPSYMRKLLSIVETRVNDHNVDVTLKFTLSALWNLTDESPKTCEVFLDEGGLSLYMRLMQAFFGENAVNTKALGLLNNIAEVPKLRYHLMTNEVITLLMTMLSNAHIDIGYFAAGVLAHMASDRIVRWSVICHSKDEAMSALFDTVCNWVSPKEEMVAYRSFQPFCPLIAIDQPHGVQMWALWAIYQVCSKNPQRYCPMLEEQAVPMIAQLSKSDSNAAVVNLANKILQLVDTIAFS